MKILILLGLAAVLPVAAEEIRISYSGVVTGLTYADCQNFSDGQCSSWVYTSIPSSNFFDGRLLSVGNPFIGSLIYNSAAHVSFVSPELNQVTFGSAVSSPTFAAGQVELPSMAVPSPFDWNLSIIDNNASNWDMFSAAAWLYGENWSAFSRLTLRDSTGTALNGFDIPTNLTLSAFNWNTVAVDFWHLPDGDKLFLDGDVLSATFSSAVSEPSRVWLSIFGVAALLARSTRRGRA